MRTKWITVIGVVVLVLAAVGVWINRDTGTAKTTAVATAAVDTGPVTVSVAATGTLEAVTRDLAFTVDGTVETVAVRAGSKVEAGATLAAVDTADATDTVGDAQDSLDTAETSLSTARSAAASASASPSAGPSASPSAGPSASAGRPSGGTRQPSGGVAATATQSDQNQSQNQNQAQTGDSSGTDAVLAAQQRVNQAGYTLGTARAALAGATIKAPISGTVLSVAGKVGSQVSSGSTFVTLADTAHMQVSADFPEADAGSIAAGQTASVTLADRVGQTFAAQVVQIDPVGTSDGTLVTYGVELSFTKAPADLLVGQTAAVQITTGRVAGALRVPATAVHEAGAGAGVVLVRSAGSSTRRTVRVGLRGDQYAQITSGLAAGDLVVRSW